MKNLTNLLASLILVLTTSTLLAQPHAFNNDTFKPDKPNREFAKHEHINQRPSQEKFETLKFLELSKTQKDELKVLKFNHYNKVKPIQAELKILRAQQEALMIAEKINVTEVNTIIDKSSALKNKLAKLKVTHRIAMNEVLTNEQQIKLELHKKQRIDMQHGKHRMDKSHRG